MGKLVEKFLEVFADRLLPSWHKETYLPLFAFVSWAVPFLVLVFFRGEPIDDLRTWTVSFIAPVILLGVWFSEHHLPKVPRNKVGLLVAITADEDKEAKQIQTDFVKELVRQLKNGAHSSTFRIIEVPRFMTESIMESQDASRKLLERTQCHFLLKGHSRLRKWQGADFHLLKLEAMVVHAPVAIEVSKAFSTDMGKWIPPDLKIAVDGDAIAFEATSAQVGLGARYTIAVAAGLSGALDYSESLLLGLEQAMKADIQHKELLTPLSAEIPKRLTELYTRMTQMQGMKYHITRKKDVLQESEIVSDKLLARDSCAYVGKLQKAIALFVLRRDIQGARNLLLSCKGHPDSTFRYGLAFLLGYEGKLKEAHDEYRHAFRNPSSSENVPIQSEEFIQLILNEEPDKGHLYFCTGLINYNAKGDLLAAKSDFERFLSIADIDSFPWAKQLAEQLLSRCK